MLEMIVFAVTLVVAQFVGGFIMYEVMMARIMNPNYLKKTYKKMFNTMMELYDEMEDED